MRRTIRETVGMSWAYRDLACYLAHAGQIAEAREALATFVAEHPGVTIAKVRDAFAFVQPGLLARYLEGLRLAGLPE